MTDIEIYYMRIPDEVVNDLSLEIKNSLRIKIVRQTEYSNFTGGPADIIIYVEEHLGEIIASGIVGNTAFTSVRYLIAGIWRKLVSLYKKDKSGIQQDKNFISLNFKIHSDRSIEFDLAGDIDENVVGKLTEQVFDYLKDKNRIESDLNNPQFQVRDTEKCKIRMRLNPITKEWEPVNFTEIEKQLHQWHLSVLSQIKD